MGRTLVASPESASLARKALEARNLTQTDLAIEVQLGYTTVSNFFNTKPIYRTNFQEICTFLNLDWRDIAAFAEETQQLTPLDELWQQLQVLSSPTEQMGLVLAQVETLGWGTKLPSRYEKSVRVGSYIRFEIDFETPGYLILLQKDTFGKMWCFCPSCFAPQPHLNSGKTTLPQAGSPIASFPIEGEAGKEEMIAILTKEIPSINWLSPEGDEPLQLGEDHLAELLTYLDGKLDCQIVHTEYEVIEKTQK